MRARLPALPRNTYWDYARLSTDGVQVMESTDISKTAVKRKIGELPSADARCRVSVSHGMATFYADGRAMGSFRMQKSTVAAKVKRTGGSGSVIIRKNRDRYYYESDGIADDGCWEIEQIGTARRALLQTAGKNASFEMKIRPIVRAGKLRVHMGYVRDSISCIAEYDFAGGEWSMRVVTDQKFEENYTAAKPLPEGELTIGSYVSDRSIVLAVNGERIFDVSSRINPTGRVGLETDGCTVEVGSVSYSGESMVVPGAVSRDFADLHTVEFIPLGGEVYMAGMNEQTKRLSGGEWVGGVYQRFTHNTLVLSDGSIVAIDYADGETADTYRDEAWVSTDGGVTFDGSYRIETEESNRITMNNKMTELSDGRLIFCAGESGHAQEVVWRVHPGSRGIKNLFAVTNKCKDIESAMRWVDKFYPEEVGTLVEDSEIWSGTRQMYELYKDYLDKETWPDPTIRQIMRREFPSCAPIFSISCPRRRRAGLPATEMLTPSGTAILTSSARSALTNTSK